MIRKIALSVLLMLGGIAAGLQPAAAQDHKPLFKGGDANEFNNWVNSRVFFPKDAKEEGVSGVCKIQFTIETSGDITNVKVLSSSGDQRLDEEAVKAVASSPKWSPAIVGGTPVRVSMVTPVIFPGSPMPYSDDFFLIKEGFNDKVYITSINHGSIVLRFKLGSPSRFIRYTIAVDPVFKYGAKTLRYGWFKPSGAILVTHEHGDHLSKETVDYLSADYTKILGNAKSIEQLGRGEALGNGDSAELITLKGEQGDIPVRVTAVPAYNTSEDRLQFHPKGNGNGYLISIGEFVIYVAGDTEPVGEMSSLGKVDVALLPCNLPYTMTPEQCIQAALTIKPKVLIPYHFGNTRIADVKNGLKDSGIDIRIHQELR